MNTHDDEWTVDHDHPTTVTLTKPRTRLEEAKAVFWAYLTPAVIAVAVLLVFGTFLGLNDKAVGALALVGVGVVYAFGVRDARRREVFRP